MKKLLLIVVLALTAQIINAQTVVIGNQTWAAKNLDVTTYIDGTSIPQVTDPADWTNLTTGAWCYYNNDSTNGATYGKLYNWYAVAGIWDEASKTDASKRKKLAPTGFHVPSDAEWTTLTDYLGGESVAGGAMKETGTNRFTALLGGGRLPNGPFWESGRFGEWWSSSESKDDTAYALFRGLNWYNVLVNNTRNDKAYGKSVRCLRDEALSIMTFEVNSFKIYPNPVVSILNIKIDNNLINQPYTIIDGLGRVVLNGKLNDVDTSINVEQLSKGIYYLKVSDNNASKFEKE